MIYFFTWCKITYTHSHWAFWLITVNVTRLSYYCDMLETFRMRLCSTVFTILQSLTNRWYFFFRWYVHEYVYLCYLQYKTCTICIQFNNISWNVGHFCVRCSFWKLTKLITVMFSKNGSSVLKRSFCFYPTYFKPWNMLNWVNNQITISALALVSLFAIIEFRLTHMHFCCILDLGKVENESWLKHCCTP